MAVTAFIALGSNLGDRAAQVQNALERIGDHPALVVKRLSSIYETEPVGGPPDQNDYLNAVVQVETDLPPQELLHELLNIEQQMGRVRAEKNAPRIIDLDLILYGNEVIDEPGLEVPHPRMHLRSFVLEPLAEIAADFVHPTLNTSIAQLWEDFDPDAVAQVEEEVEEPEYAPAPIKSQTLMGMRALVTGSTSGIGRAIALAFAAAGASVIVHGRREQAADDVANEIEALGVESGVMLADLSELQDCRELVESTWAEWGPFDVWVNNAGADTLTGEAADMSFVAKLHALFDVDVTATMLMSRDVGRRMREVGKGLILNIGWDRADIGMEGDSGQLFAASKAAVTAFSKSLALTLAPEVRVNCLAPGWTRTGWGRTASEYWQKRAVAETPLGRWGTPEDIAAAAVWLASPAAAFITGQVIRINGGAVR